MPARVCGQTADQLGDQDKRHDAGDQRRRCRAATTDGSFGSDRAEDGTGGSTLSRAKEHLAALAPLTAAVDRAAAVLSPTEAAAVTRFLRLAAEFLNRYAAGS